MWLGLGFKPVTDCLFARSQSYATLSYDPYGPGHDNPSGPALTFFAFFFTFFKYIYKMSGSSEEEFSDAELLEQTTFIENTESLCNLLSDESIQNFIKG